jgi:branched-chain amino acid transport system ATP-binding protein
MADTMIAPRSAAGSGGAMLEVRNLEAWYGESHVLHGVSLDIRQGEVVTLLGRNGAGKTSTLRAIMGLVGRRTGSIRFEGKELVGLRPDLIARTGIGYCPEERGIFASLDVTENLMLPPKIADGGLSLDEIYTLFPNLKERARSQGTKLSGGEQQMLAIARILRTGARLLLLDEPSEGLAPVIVQQIGAMIRQIKQRGFTVLLVEQNFRFAQTVADRHYVMEHGRVVDTVANSELSASMGPAARIPGRLRPGRTQEETKNHGTRPPYIAHRRRGAARAGRAALPQRPRPGAEHHRIGVLNDQSGLYRDLSGPGSTQAVRLAIQESGITHARRQRRGGAGRPPEPPRRRLHRGAPVDRPRRRRRVVDVPTSSSRSPRHPCARGTRGLYLLNSGARDVAADPSKTRAPVLSPQHHHWTYDLMLARSTARQMVRDRRVPSP